MKMDEIRVQENGGKEIGQNRSRWTSLGKIWERAYGVDVDVIKEKWRKMTSLA